MPDTTPIYGFPFPEDTDPPDGAGQIEALALAMDAVDAGDIPFTPVGSIAATDVQAAIAEINSDAFPLGLAAWTSFTPTLTQGATPTKTSNCVYTRVGKLVVARYHLAVTSAGTATNAISIGLPVTATGLSGAIGTFWMNDAGTSFYSGIAYLASGTTMNLVNGGANTAVMGATGGGFTAALASGDTITATIQYEAA